MRSLSLQYLGNISIVLASIIFPFTSRAQGLESQFQHILDSVYLENDSAVGMLFHVEAPDLHLSWTSAAGYAEKNVEKKVNKNQPALIASNTKTYVAAAVLKLVELEQITLNESIEDLIHKNTRVLLKKDGYNLLNIQVKHLLSHTSGIADYVNDEYFEFINKNPQHKWKRGEQIQLAIEVGEPLYNTGEDYTYADINFLLLTEIIEQKTGQPFYLSIRQLLDFKKHGLNETWFVDLEEKPMNSLPIVHQYWDKRNWDSYNLNPSWDLYGGGGLVSTTKDLARFFSLLFNGEIIQNKTVLQEMYSFVLPKDKSVYCLGLMHISFHDYKAYYHGGFWGTDVMYIPELNVTISAFTLQKEKRGLNPKVSYEFIKCLKAR